jgi:Ca2+/H+ antiporter
MNGMPWRVLRREWSLLIGAVLLVTLEVSHVLDWLVLQNSALVLGGLLVGVLVVAPEALNAFQSANRGEVQRSLNTLYGSSLSTLCLTVPAVLMLGEWTHTDVVLGLEPMESLLLALMLLTVGVVWVALQVV